MFEAMRTKGLYYFRRLFQLVRIWKYQLLSDNKVIGQQAQRNQPVLASGEGVIKLGACQLGVWPSPYYFNGYIHIEARAARARVEIGHGVWVNNNAVIIAECDEITIGDNTLIGSECTIYDSDFHDLHPDRRMGGVPSTGSVHIGRNVFIGSRVTILKGVSIGDNAVIANGSVVTGSLPSDCVAGGVPAKILRQGWSDNI